MPRYAFNIATIATELPHKHLTLVIKSGKSKHLGKLFINRNEIEWASGKKQKGNGISISLKDLVEIFEKRAEEKKKK